MRYVDVTRQSQQQKCFMVVRDLMNFTTCRGRFGHLHV